jgi:YD repeat-containing protein
MGLVSKTDYDLLGRTVRTIQNFVAFAPSNSADQTTQYTYDGSNHILTLSAVLPGYVLETTTYTYGVTGSTINSNDLLASVAYPGQTQTDSYTYDAVGEKLTYTDRNGTTHAYTYDILGRQTADTVTALGPGVDGTVIEITTAYDAGGRPYLYTSYGYQGGLIMRNQVQQTYDSLGHLLTEYQKHALYSSTIYYSYAFASNNLRLVALRDPANGYYVSYTYNPGVDDAISRVSQISNLPGSDVESYSYLGLNTVVERSQTVAGDPPVNLT